VTADPARGSVRRSGSSEIRAGAAADPLRMVVFLPIWRRIARGLRWMQVVGWHVVVCLLIRR
jgi:hypothetical protein